MSVISQQFLKTLHVSCSQSECSLPDALPSNNQLVFLLFLGYSFNDPYTRPLSQCSSNHVIMFTNCCSQTRRYSVGQLRHRIRFTYSQLISPLVITRLHDLNIHRRRGRCGGQRNADPSGLFCQGPASPKVHLRMTETALPGACLIFLLICGCQGDSSPQSARAIGSVNPTTPPSPLISC